MTVLRITGGRVVDPESGYDQLADVRVEGDRVVQVAAELPPVPGESLLDASDCIVAPGFIDLHSHAQGPVGNRLQAFDGVTTALELEAGSSPVADAYAEHAREGRLLHHGFSASWAAVRMEVLAGHERRPGLAHTLAGFAYPQWAREATPAELDRMLGLLTEELEAGALGIGVLVGYAQDASEQEYLQVAALAAAAGRPTWTHARDLVEVRPDVRIDGADEIARAAAETGAHMHFCHVNSTSGRQIEHVLGMVDDVRREGGSVTTEAYPYGAGMTGIGAAFLAPDQLPLRGLGPSSLVVVATGERIATVERLVELRDADPGTLVSIDFLDEADAADRALLLRALSAPAGIIASDAIEPVPTADGTGLTTHPRTAGTFSRALRTLVDVVGEDWGTALARVTLHPARTLEAAVPAMARKGRLRAGSDADIVVFSPDALRDRATFDAPTTTSAGVRHLLVAGTPLIRGSVLDAGARPGRAIRA